jgi:hypothetical protein
MIQNLDDTTARQILATIVRSRTGQPDTAMDWSPALAEALGGAFQVQPETSAVSEGELARQALLVLAEDPPTRQAIETMAANWSTSRQKFDFGASMAITAAVLLVLQTHVKFDRTPAGKWSLSIEKKPTSDSLLKGLVQKLISFGKASS